MALEATAASVCDAAATDDLSTFVLCHSSQVLARNVYKRSALMLQVVTEEFMLQVLQKMYAYVCSI